MPYTAPVTDQLIVLVGVDEGIFKKYGVNVTTKYIPEGEAVDALVSGQAQMAVFAAPSTEVTRASGQQAEWIAAWENHMNVALIARPGIKNVSQLSGKAVGITVAGAPTAVLTSLALQSAGVLNKAHLEPLGSISAQVAAFQSGAISAWLIGPPLLNELLQKVHGSSVIVNYEKEYPWVGSGIATMAPWASAHKQEVVDVMRGLVATVKYFESHPAQSEQIIGKATSATTAQAAQSYQSVVSLMKSTNSLVPSTSAEKEVISAIRAQNFKGAKNLTPGELVDASYLNKALG